MCKLFVFRKFEKQKSLIVDAYVKKMVSLIKMKVIAGVNLTTLPEFANTNLNLNTNAEFVEYIQEIYTAVGQFTDYTDTKVFHHIYLK